jgi:hypothetical protein
VNPFLRNLGILAAVALAIVLLDAETALVTASILLRFAFFIVVAVVLYLFWRDVARHEVATWPDRKTRVFYAAVALMIVDAGWWIVRSPQGRNALISIVVAVICVYVGYSTWREQKRYS